MSAPCSWRRHRWGAWYALQVTIVGADRRPMGAYDTQERACSRCGREQRKRWWRR